MLATRYPMILGLGGLAVALCGCRRPAQESAATSAPVEAVVVVYTALDRQFSEPILNDFAAQTGIQTQPVYDTESTKTVGLANRIRAEAARPRCDVFWNNEILNTLRLKAEGLLQPCRATQAEYFPPRYRDPDGYWYGFAARARVLIVNTELVGPDELPQSIRDLGLPKWRGRVGIAKPLFGTTASHVACLFAGLGPEKARELLDTWKQNNIQVVSGNKACAEMVAAGRLAFALTDTDDAIAEQEQARPVRIVFPDSTEAGLGTLLLPNTLAVVKGAPHPQAAVRLIDYLLSADVEARLAAGPSAQIPLHRDAPSRSRVCNLAEIKPMEVDFARAAEMFPTAAEYAEKQFLK